MRASRLQQVIGTSCLIGALLVAGAGFTRHPATGRTPIVTIGSIASQLGVSVVMGNDDEFAVGVQFTGVLQAPEKLDVLGLTGMHSGARVYAARIGPDRVQVEADELNPPKRATAKLKLDANGKLLAAPKVVATTAR